MIKLVREQKKSQLRYYQMVLYTVKNLLPIIDILKTLPSSRINDYIKILQRQHSRKTVVKELRKKLNRTLKIQMIFSKSLKN